MAEQESSANQAKPDEKSADASTDSVSKPIGDGANNKETKAIQQEATNEQKETNKLMRTWNWLKRKADEANLADYLIVLLTAVIAFWAGMTWWEMHDAGTQTNKIIAADERLATAMENSVTKSGDALKASIEASRTDQRAWVGFENAQVNVHAGNQSRFSVNVKNTGKTPALHVSLQYFIKNVERGQALQFTYKGITTVPSRGMLAPNGIFSVILTNAEPDAAEMNRIRTEEKHVYFYGRLTYNDIFGRSHWTTFCTYMSQEGNAMVSCSEYNNTDDEEKARQ
jgi:hypothetical protein